jgi:ferritin-like metal-binding protein YciE
MDKHSNFDLLFETTLRHLYKAENEVIDALSLMAESAQSSELRKAVLHHQDETSSQIDRLENIFSFLDIDVNSSKLQGIKNLKEQGKHLLKTLIDLNFTDRSKGMNGILSEGKELIRHFKDTEANDFALITAGGRVESFEIGCYTFLCLLAEKIGIKEILQPLTTSLKEEQAMEQKMRAFAEEGIRTISNASAH